MRFTKLGLLQANFECWSTAELAYDEVEESFGEGRISRIAVDEAGNVMGWIAGISQYSGRVWELHPLVVSKSHRMKGVGAMLVADFEQQAAARGAITIILGSDDEDSSTSFAGQDLYSDFPAQLANFEGNNHPTSFYYEARLQDCRCYPRCEWTGQAGYYAGEASEITILLAFAFYPSISPI